MPKIKSFITPEGTLSQEEFYNQIKEMKRLVDLKEQEKKSEEELKKLLNPTTFKAQALKCEEHEEKKAKILNEFNKCISERTDPLPITKISYVVNSSKTATMRITRDKDPLNLRVYPDFRLRMLGLTAEEKKRKRSEFLKEVFVTKDVKVDGMNRNLIPPPEVMPIEGLVIKEPKSGIFFMNRNMNLAFQRENEFHLTPTVTKGLSECKALESNVRRIQVKDIIKEVEDYLKTYSSAGMDISYSVSVPALHKKPRRYKVQYAVSRCMTRSSTNELFSPFKNPKREFRSSRRLFKTLSLDETRTPGLNLFSDLEDYSEEEEAETMAETIADYGSDHEDANEHIEKVLEIMDLFHIPNITIDQVMLRAFPIKYFPPARTAKKMEEINNFQQEPDENLYHAWERFKEILMKCPQHYLMEMQEVVLFYNGLDVPT
ncbi:retrovirus-related pol polyprotein from transposon TNT 1-94 [Tanacetum coccineum]